MTSQPSTTMTEQTKYTATWALLSELEDEVEGIAIEKRLFESAPFFYVTVILKMVAKFPHKDKKLNDLAFLDTSNHNSGTSRAISRLCKHFMTENPDEIDAAVQEYLAYRVAP